MKRKWLWSLILSAYVLFIFSNSLTPAVLSSKESGRVLNIGIHLFEGMGVSARWLTEHLIRKTAHFIEYLVLGVLLLNCLEAYGFSAERRIWLAVSAGFFIPFVDETLQLFTAGRSGQLSDVWLDCAGVAAGAAVFCITRRFCRPGREKKSGEKL